MLIRNIKYLMTVLICYSNVFSLEYSIHPNFGIINIEDEIYNTPFLGGFNKPKVQWVDWDNDNDADLFLLDEDGLIRYYNNLGNNIFELISSNFLDVKNISWFFIHDFDNDDFRELITQDSNNIDQMIYYNIMDMEVVSEGTVYDINEVPVQSDAVMTPTFVDIDNDGDLDFFTGNMIGTISFYNNIGFDDSQIPQFELVTNFWEDIYIVGSSNRHGASAINFIDIDQDADYDLSWGDYYQQSLYIITNIGTPENAIMDNVNIVNQFPPNNPVITAGQNMPSFSDVDDDGDQDLFITVLSGAYGYRLINNFYYYEKQDSAYEFQTYNFIKTLDLVSDVYPNFIDIDNDMDLDLFIGTDFDVSSFPWIGKIYYFENIGLNDGEVQWELVSSDLLEEDLGNNLAIDFADIDYDSDYDLFIGDFNGFVKLYKNVGNSSNPHFIFEEQLNNIDLSGYSVPKLVDIDNDNDFDLFIGSMNGQIAFYLNHGDNENYEFILESNNYANILVGNRSAPEFIDIDYDGDFDLIIGSQYNGLSYYENIGDKENPNYILNENINFPNVGNNSFPAFLNKHNPRELCIGISTGGLYYLVSDYCLPGDLNNDLIINVSDIISVINIIIGNDVLNSDVLCQADLNNDSIVNVIDIISIINIIISDM